MIRGHLEDSDLDVTLVVFNPGAFRIAQSLSERVEAYIDENYVAAQTAAEYGGADEVRMREQREARRRREYAASEAFWNQTVSMDAFEAPAEPKAAAPKPAAQMPLPSGAVPQAVHDAAFSRPVGAASASSAKAKKPSLDQVVKNLGESFQARLLRMIDERGLADAEVYHRANISKQVFSKIRCSEDYIPKKKTVLALAVGLRLNLDDTKDLLAAAGFTLTNNSLFDVIMSFCIESEMYDIFEINELLFKYGQPYLGTTMD